MKLLERNGVYLIQEDEDDTFWAYYVHTFNVTNTTPDPKLKDFLADWWNETAPGQWSTARHDGTASILIRDPSLFLLFKLAWQGREEVTRPKMKEQTFVYCPYIPLQMTTRKPIDPADIDPSAFKTRVYYDPNVSSPHSGKEP